jgi:cytosine/adenosine deaminase-related metal-dependent hydrolase
MSDGQRSITLTHVIGPDGPMAGAQTIALANGRIASIDAVQAASEQLLALPALVNTHDHGFRMQLTRHHLHFL